MVGRHMHNGQHMDIDLQLDRQSGSSTFLPGDNLTGHLTFSVQQVEALPPMLTTGWRILCFKFFPYESVRVHGLHIYSCEVRQLTS